MDIELDIYGGSRIFKPQMNDTGGGTVHTTQMPGLYPRKSLLLATNEPSVRQGRVVSPSWPGACGCP